MLTHLKVRLPRQLYGVPIAHRMFIEKRSAFSRSVLTMTVLLISIPPTILFEVQDIPLEIIGWGIDVLNFFEDLLGLNGPKRSDPELLEVTEPNLIKLLKLTVFTPPPAIDFNQSLCSSVNYDEESEVYSRILHKLCSNSSYDQRIRAHIQLLQIKEKRLQVDQLFDRFLKEMCKENDILRERLLSDTNYNASGAEQESVCCKTFVRELGYHCLDTKQNLYVQKYIKVFARACSMKALFISDIPALIAHVCPHKLYLEGAY